MATETIQSATCCRKSGQGCICGKSDPMSTCAQPANILQLLKQNVLVAKSTLLSATAAKPQRRIKLRDPAAHVVSHTHLSSSQVLDSGTNLARGRYSVFGFQTLIQFVGARPAGACTCDRASTENKTPSGSTCSCGVRPAGRLLPFYSETLF
jgi:hypothetical protein